MVSNSDPKRSYIELAEGMARAVAASLESARRASEALRPVLEQIAKIDFSNIAKIAKAFQELPTRTRDALTELAKHGWYIDEEMGINVPLGTSSLFGSGKTAEAHSVLMAYYNETSEQIFERVSADFPSRRKILGQSFKAHRAGDFGLSVPVFLAQADGICFDLIGAQLYSKRGSSTAVAVALKNLGLNDSMFVHPLTEIFPIAFGVKERAADADGLSRHAVLHGESVSYDTSQNSCKAMSLLAFTAWILAAVKDKSKP